MRRVPSILATTTALLVLAAVPAHAAGCPSLTDVAGDGRWDTAPISSPAWDILSADVSTGPTTLVATLRLASLSPDTQTGFSTWRLGWNVGSTGHGVEARTSSGFPVAEYSNSAGSIPVPLTVDRAAGTLTWTVPRSAVPGLTGATLWNISATTLFLSSTADTAFAPGTFHVDGTPGCIPAA